MNENQTMTIKQLAEVAGCYPRTINNIVKKNFPDLISNGKTTKFTKDQAYDIMALLPKRNLVNDLDKNSKVVQGSEIKELVNSVNILVGTIGRMLPLLANGKTYETEPVREILPPMEPRQELKMIMDRYVAKKNIGFPEAWGQLYSACLYRLRINIRTQAANRNMKPLDWIEENGYLQSVLELARVEFQ